MDSKLFVKAITKFLSGLILVGLLLFLPAGTFAYPQGWLLIGILFVPMFIAGLIMGIVCRSSSFSGRLCSVCRGVAGKCLAFPYS